MSMYRIKNHVYSSLLTVVLLILFGCCSSALAISSLTQVEKQEEATQYVQKAILATWYTEVGAYPVSAPEQLSNFKKAAEIDPNNINLKFYLASTYENQDKLPETINVYKEIITQNPEYFHGLLCYAIYNKGSRHEGEYEKTMQKLEKLNPKKAEKYKTLVKRCMEISRMGISSEVKKISSVMAGVIVLGDALKHDGTPGTYMPERVKKAAELYAMNKNIKIIVSGGVSENGITEAYLMKKLLVEKHGVPSSSIYLEDRSRDTVENAYYSLQIANTLNLDHITVIDSSWHIKRSYSLFEEMFRGFKVVPLPATDVKPNDPQTNKQLTDILRDTLRASGVWLYPGLFM